MFRALEASGSEFSVVHSSHSHVHISLHHSFMLVHFSISRKPDRGIGGIVGGRGLGNGSQDVSVFGSTKAIS